MAFNACRWLPVARCPLPGPSPAPRGGTGCGTGGRAAAPGRLRPFLPLPLTWASSCIGARKWPVFSIAKLMKAPSYKYVLTPPLPDEIEKQIRRFLSKHEYGVLRYPLKRGVRVAGGAETESIFLARSSVK